MDSLFRILFYVSFVCLIIGLIKPTIFSRFIKGGSTRKKVLIIFGIMALVFAFLFGVTTDTSKNNQATENTQNTSQTEVKESNIDGLSPKLEKIENIEERTAAIKKVKTSADQEMLARMGSLISFIDVYKNPKGEGAIVWMGSIARPNSGFIYLISDSSVYAVNGDASVLSPDIPSSKNLAFEDLKEIGEMRSLDYKMLLEACLKDVETLKENGLVEKTIKEAEDKCYLKYEK